MQTARKAAQPDVDDPRITLLLRDSTNCQILQACAQKSAEISARAICPGLVWSCQTSPLMRCSPLDKPLDRFPG